jgi:hypothetical protein
VRIRKIRAPHQFFKFRKFSAPQPSAGYAKRYAQQVKRSESGSSRYIGHHLCRFGTFLTHKKVAKVVPLGEPCGTCCLSSVIARSDSDEAIPYRSRYEEQRQRGSLYHFMRSILFLAVKSPAWIRTKYTPGPVTSPASFSPFHTTECRPAGHASYVRTLTTRP